MDKHKRRKNSTDISVQTYETSKWSEKEQSASVVSNVLVQKHRTKPHFLTFLQRNKPGSQIPEYHSHKKDSSK